MVTPNSTLVSMFHKHLCTSRCNFGFHIVTSTCRKRAVSGEVEHFHASLSFFLIQTVIKSAIFWFTWKFALLPSYFCISVWANYKCYVYMCPEVIFTINNVYIAIEIMWKDVWKKQSHIFTDFIQNLCYCLPFADRLNVIPSHVINKSVPRWLQGLE